MDWLAGVGRVLRDSVWGWDGYRRLLRAPRPWVHIALLSFVITVVGLIVITSTSRGSLAQLRESVASLPDFSLRDGRFQADVPQPYVVEGEDGSVVMIDTTGMLGPSALDPYSNGLLVTSDMLYIKSSDVQVQTYRLSQFKGVDFDREALLTFFDAAVPWMVVLAAVGGFAANWVRIVIDVAALSILLLIVASLARRRASWADTFAASAYGMTLPVGLGLIPSFRFDWVVFWGVAVAYGVGGLLRALPRDGGGAGAEGTGGGSAGGGGDAPGDEQPRGDGSGTPQ